MISNFGFAACSDSEVMATLQEWRNSGLWERGALPPQEGKSQLFLEAANGNFKSQWKNPPRVFPNDPQWIG